MKRVKLHYIFLFFLLFGISAAQAQVTVGSSKQPVQGALLDLKEYNVTDPESVNGTSASKGLGLPRVNLIVLNQLFPMFDGIDGTDYTKNDGSRYDKATEDLKHTGLTVYNLTVDATEDLVKGVYFWDGSRWVMAGGSTLTGLKFFYMPSINISFTTTGTNRTINLYEEYEKQFTRLGNSTFKSSDAGITTIPAPADGTLYAAKDLAFVVTYYDTKVINIQSISSTGEMVYDILSIKTTADSYINVVFVIK